MDTQAEKYKIVGKTVIFGNCILRGNDFDLIIRDDKDGDINITAESGTIKAYGKNDNRQTNSSEPKSGEQPRSGEAEPARTNDGSSNPAPTGGNEPANGSDPANPASGNTDPADPNSQPKSGEEGESNAGGGRSAIPPRPKSWIRGKTE